MNLTKKRYICIIFLLLYCIILPYYTQASMREIMIGDVITLKINAPGLSRFDLINKFSEFEVVDLKKINNNEKSSDNEYIIAIRSFEAGLKNIQIADKDIKIKVVSLLENTDRDELFEPDLSIKKPSSIYSVIIILSQLIILILLLQLFILIKNIIKNKSVKKQDINPFLLAKQRLQGCEKEKRYFANLTFIFKDYISNIYELEIMDKTPEEITAVIKKYDELKGYAKKIEKYLLKLEEYKYKDVDAADELKQEEKSNLFDLIKSIDRARKRSTVEGS